MRPGARSFAKTIPATSSSVSRKTGRRECSCHLDHFPPRGVGVDPHDVEAGRHDVLDGRVFE
jgi:hypothetical protein